MSRCNKDIVVQQHGTQTKHTCHVTTKSLSYSSMGIHNRHMSRYNKDTIIQQHGTQTTHTRHATTRTHVTQQPRQADYRTATAAVPVRVDEPSSPSFKQHPTTPRKYFPSLVKCIFAQSETSIHASPTLGNRCESTV